MPRQPPTAAIPTEIATTDDIPLGEGQASFEASMMAPYTSGAIAFKQVWGEEDDSPVKGSEPTTKDAASETKPKTSEKAINTNLSAKPFTAPAFTQGGSTEAESDAWWGQDCGLLSQDGLLSQATNLDDLPPALTEAVKADSILTAPALAMKVVTELMRTQAEDDPNLHACWKRLPANSMPCPVPSALPFPLLNPLNSLNPYLVPMYQQPNIMVGGQPVHLANGVPQQANATEGEEPTEQPKKRRRRRHRGRGRRGRGRKKAADEEGEGDDEPGAHSGDDQPEDQ